MGEIFLALIRRALSAGLVIVFDPKNHPKYVPAHQSHRRDKKAFIEMPALERYVVIPNETDDKIQKLLCGLENLEEKLCFFAHEFGHHLVDSFGYDEALNRCLRLPVSKRDPADIDLVVRVETEAWSKGFAELESLGWTIPKWAHEVARKSVQEYADGCRNAHPKFPSAL